MQQQSKIRFDVKLPLILIHTPFGLTFFDKVARTRVAKSYAKFTTYLMPIITALAFFLIIVQSKGCQCCTSQFLSGTLPHSPQYIL